jgi:hypothetical protein
MAKYFFNRSHAVGVGSQEHHWDLVSLEQGSRQTATVNHCIIHDKNLILFPFQIFIVKGFYELQQEICERIGVVISNMNAQFHNTRTANGCNDSQGGYPLIEFSRAFLPDMGPALCLVVSSINMTFIDVDKLFAFTEQPNEFNSSDLSLEQ